MCQMSVVLEQDGTEESIMESASRLDVIEDGITVSTLFEESKQLSGVTIRSIDFLAGKVILQKNE